MKKFLSLTLALVMIISMVTVVGIVSTSAAEEWIDIYYNANPQFQKNYNGNSVVVDETEANGNVYRKFTLSEAGVREALAGTKSYGDAARVHSTMLSVSTKIPAGTNVRAQLDGLVVDHKGNFHAPEADYFTFSYGGIKAGRDTTTYAPRGDNSGWYTMTFPEGVVASDANMLVGGGNGRLKFADTASAIAELMLDYGVYYGPAGKLEQDEAKHNAVDNWFSSWTAADSLTVDATNMCQTNKVTGTFKVWEDMSSTACTCSDADKATCPRYIKTEEFVKKASQLYLGLDNLRVQAKVKVYENDKVTINGAGSVTVKTNSAHDDTRDVTSGANVKVNDYFDAVYTFAATNAADAVAVTVNGESATLTNGKLTIAKADAATAHDIVVTYGGSGAGGGEGGGDNNPVVPADFKSINLDKQDTDLAVGETTAITLTGVKADGSSAAATGATYKVTPISGAAELTNDGKITAKSKGMVVLEATLGELKDSVIVNIGGKIFENNFETVDKTIHTTNAYKGSPDSNATYSKNWIGTAIQGTDARSGSGSLDVISITKDTPDSVFETFVHTDGTKGADGSKFKKVYDLRLNLNPSTDAWKESIKKMTAIVEFWVKPRDNFFAYDSNNGGYCHRTNGVNISFNGTGSKHPLRGNLRSSSSGYWCWLEQVDHGAVIVNDKIPVKNEWTQIVIDASHADGTVNLYIDGQLFRSHVCNIDGCDCKTNRAFDEFQITRNPYATPSGDENGCWFDDLRMYDMSGPMAPAAGNVKIEGRAVVGETLTGTYKYSDANGDEENGTAFRWLKCDTEGGKYEPISGATAKTLEITKDLDGMYVVFEVTPKNAAAVNPAGSPVTSAPVYITNNAPEVTNVAIKGTANSGSTLMVSYKFSDKDGDDEGTSTYQWYISSTQGGKFDPIKDATAQHLTLNDSYVDKYVKVGVTPVDEYGKAGVEVISAAATLINKKPEGGEGGEQEKPDDTYAIFVATDGNDSNDGTEKAPLKTIEAAKEKIRAMRNAGQYPATGITVYFREGVYPISKTVEFTAEDSGDENAKIVYRPYGNEKVQFSGGAVFKLSDFTAVEGAMKDLLIDETAKSKVVVANVSKLGITSKDIMELWTNNSKTYDGGIHFRGAGGTERNEALFGVNMEMDGIQMPLARYPNSSYQNQWLSCSGDDGTYLKYSSDRLDKWTFSTAQDQGIWARGYWEAEWTCDFVQLKGLDAANNKMNVTVRTASNRDPSATKGGQFWNVYEEIDEPGEWYFDRATGNLYIYPVEGANSNSQVEMSRFDKTLINAREASNITFYNLDFTGSNAMYGLALTNCQNVVLDACDLHNFGAYALLIQGKNSRNNGIKNGSVYNCIAGGIRMIGGDSAKLIKSNDFVSNNMLYDCSVRRDSYAPAVDLSFNGDYNEGSEPAKEIDPNLGAPSVATRSSNQGWEDDDWVEGCGNIVSHNHFKNSPGMMMWYRGPLHTVEYNIFEQGCYNAKDMGVIYAGRRPHDSGGVIRYNHFVNIGSKLNGTYYPCCIFFDDGSLDCEIYGNVFGPGTDHCEVIKFHGGVEFNVYNNVFIDATRFVKNQVWDSDRWYDSYSKFQNDSGGTVISVVLPNKDKYIEAMPWMENYIKGIEGGTRYWGKNYYGKNVFINISSTLSSFINGSSQMVNENNARFSGNPSVHKTYLKDYEGGNYTLTDVGYAAIRAQIPDFPTIPFEAIGPGTSLNQAPEVLGVFINKSGENTLNGSYVYNDAEGDPEGESIYTWLVADVDQPNAYKVIEGVSGLTFTYDASYLGKYIRLEVTPVDIDGNKGAALRSAAIVLVKGSEGLNTLVAQAEDVLKGVTEGTGLGQYPTSAVDALEAAIAAAKEPGFDIDGAIAALNKALNDFDAAKITKVEIAENATEITVPSDLPGYEVVVPDVKGTFTVKADKLPAGKIIANINGKKVTIEATAEVALKDGKFEITELDKTNAANAESVVAAMVLGCDGETYDPALKITIDDILNYTVGSVKDNAVADIEGVNYVGSSASFDLTAGKEIVVYGNLIVSDDATLKALAVNGTPIELEKGVYNYSIKLPAGVTTAVITAEANEENAKVEIPVVSSVPVRGVEVKVTAHKGNRLTYTLDILITQVVPDDDDNQGSGSGGSSGSGSTGGSGSGSNVGPYAGNSYLSSVVIAEEIETKNKMFSDIVGHWAQNDIMAMYEAGVVSGVTEDTFEPDRNITRAEFATLIVKALGLNESGSAVFYDVKSTDWFAPYVGAAADAGLIAGFEGSFRPNDTITRQEMAVVIMKAYGYLGKTAKSGNLDSFSDKGQVAGWAYDAVSSAVATGLMSGMSEDIFAPTENATRAQATSLIKRLIS